MSKGCSTINFFSLQNFFKRRDYNLQRINFKRYRMSQKSPFFQINYEKKIHPQIKIIDIVLRKVVDSVYENQFCKVFNNFFF